MARRRRALGRRTRVQRFANAVRRRSRRSSGMMYAKKAAYGAGLGLAISIPLTLAGRYFGRGEIIEAGQRIGSVASAHVGGSVGNAAYQAADAVFDRFVVFQGNSISGTQGAAAI